MALRESRHAHRGRLGVHTKKEENIRTYPKKKKKKKKKRSSGFIAPRFTGKKREKPFEELWLNGYPPHPKNSKKTKSKNVQKNQEKKIKKNSKTVSVKTISRTTIPRERINQKGKQQKS